MAASRLLRVCGPRAPMFAFLGFAYAGKLLLKLFTMSYLTATAQNFPQREKKDFTVYQILILPGYWSIRILKNFSKYQTSQQA